jgi:histidine triad (HIT) family protein
MPSIFSRIVAGEIPAYKVAEEEHYLAFLDIFPLKRGHVLVIPKVEVDQLLHLDEPTYMGLMAFARRVGQGIQQAIPCKRIGMAVLGMEVPHAHIHLVPLDHESDLSFARPKLQLSSEDMQAIAERIAQAITASGQDSPE